MATGGSQNPISAGLSNHMVFDAGAVYLNWSIVATELLLGVTRGGSRFEYTRELREIEADGAKGMTRGLKRVVRHDVKLSCTFLEMSNKAWNYFLYGSDRTSDAVHITHVPALQVIDANYVTNIALVAEASATTPGGAPYVLKLLNALPGGEMSFQSAQNDEGLLEMVFEGHFTIADQVTVPFELLHPVGAS